MDEQPDLDGLSAPVTEATSGIGRAAAKELGRRGAEVVVHGPDPACGAPVAGAITAEGGKARFAVADFSDPAQLDDLAEQADAVDILVDNAGIPWLRPTAELDVTACQPCARAWSLSIAGVMSRARSQRSVRRSRSHPPRTSESSVSAGSSATTTAWPGSPHHQPRKATP